MLTTWAAENQAITESRRTTSLRESPEPSAALAVRRFWAQAQVLPSAELQQAPTLWLSA